MPRVLRVSGSRTPTNPPRRCKPTSMPAGLRVGLLSPGQTKAICSRVEGCRTSVLASRVGCTEGRLLLGIVGGCCMWVTDNPRRNRLDLELVELHFCLFGSSRPPSHSTQPKLVWPKLSLMWAPHFILRGEKCQMVHIPEKMPA